MALTPEQNAAELELIRRYEKNVEEYGPDDDFWPPESEMSCRSCGEEQDVLINGLCWTCDEEENW